MIHCCCSCHATGRAGRLLLATLGAVVVYLLAPTLTVVLVVVATLFVAGVLARVGWEVWTRRRDDATEAEIRAGWAAGTRRVPDALPSAPLQLEPAPPAVPLHVAAEVLRDGVPR